ncbi:MAG: hypothetical protein ACRDA8_00610 [Shewanella sp.]
MIKKEKKYLHKKNIPAYTCLNKSKQLPSKTNEADKMSKLQLAFTIAAVLTILSMAVFAVAAVPAILGGNAIAGNVCLMAIATTTAFAFAADAIKNLNK